MTNLKLIRELIESGLTDAEIETYLTEGQAAADAEYYAHGESRETFGTTSGRNDAGEWKGYM